MKVNASGETVRDVVLRLRTEIDPGNDAKLREMGRKVQAAQGGATGAGTPPASVFGSTAATRAMAARSPAEIARDMAAVHAHAARMRSLPNAPYSPVSQTGSLAAPKLLKEQEAATKALAAAEEKRYAALGRYHMAEMARQRQYAAQAASAAQQAITNQRHFQAAANQRHGGRGGGRGMVSGGLEAMRGGAHLLAASQIFGDNEGLQTALQTMMLAEGGIHVARGAGTMFQRGMSRNMQAGVLGFGRREAAALGLAGVGAGATGLLGAGAAAVAGVGAGLFYGGSSFLAATDPDGGGFGGGARPGTGADNMGGWVSGALGGIGGWLGMKSGLERRRPTSRGREMAQKRQQMFSNMGIGAFNSATLGIGGPILRDALAAREQRQRTVRMGERLDHSRAIQSRFEANQAFEFGQYDTTRQSGLSNDLFFHGMRGGSAGGSLDIRRASADQAMAGAQAESDPATAYARVRQAASEILEIEKARLSVQQSQLQNIQQQAASARSGASGANDSATSIGMDWISARPSERARALRAQEALKSGKPLTRRQLMRDTWLLDQNDSRLQDEIQRQAKGLGADKLESFQGATQLRDMLKSSAAELAKSATEGAEALTKAIKDANTESADLLKTQIPKTIADFVAVLLNAVKDGAEEAENKAAQERETRENQPTK